MTIMIAALAGMVFCNRQRHKKTQYQVFALVLLLVVIISGGTFMYNIDTMAMFGLKNEEQSEKLDHALSEAQGYVLANFIKNKYPAKCKVLLISQNGNSSFDQAFISNLCKNEVDNVIREQLSLQTVDDKLITPPADRAAENRAIDQAIAKHTDCNIVVLAGISPSGESLYKLQVYRLPYDRRPALFVVGMTNLNSWAYNQLHNGFFEALVTANPAKTIPTFEALPENPIDVFSQYYVLITKDNLQRNQRFFHR